MLEMYLDIVPFGEIENQRNLNKVVIYNDATTENNLTGNYVIEIYDQDEELIYETTYKNWDRSQSALKLLTFVLNKWVKKDDEQKLSDAIDLLHRRMGKGT